MQHLSFIKLIQDKFSELAKNINFSLINEWVTLFTFSAISHVNEEEWRLSIKEAFVWVCHVATLDISIIEQSVRHLH